MERTRFDVMIQKTKLVKYNAFDIPEVTKIVEEDYLGWKVIDVVPSEKQGDTNGN